MSYTSRNRLSKNTNVDHLRSIINLLGYKSIARDTAKTNHIASYIWLSDMEYQSWVGIELQVYRNKSSVRVDTRTRVSRSYWELKHQNATIKMIRDLFGGYFETDMGRNRYMRPSEPPPKPLAAECFLARWRFENALKKLEIYRNARNLEGSFAKNVRSGFVFLDEFNPRLLSNNLAVPYVLAIWEEYFRSTFVALLRHSTISSVVFKKVRFDHERLVDVSSQKLTWERSIAESFGFQRPSQIAENFRLLDPKLDLGALFRKPYSQRKRSLFESIEELVGRRNMLVHTGNLDLTLFDQDLDVTISDIIVAIERSYLAFGKHFQYEPILDNV